MGVRFGVRVRVDAWIVSARENVEVGWRVGGWKGALFPPMRVHAASPYHTMARTTALSRIMVVVVCSNHLLAWTVKHSSRSLCQPSRANLCVWGGREEMSGGNKEWGGVVRWGGVREWVQRKRRGQ